MPTDCPQNRRRSGHRGSVRTPRTDGGTWSYRIDLGFDDVGKRRQREIGGFHTKKEAQAALNDALSGVQRGTFVAPSRTTVRDVLELWLDGVKTEVALTAWVSYRQAVRRYINPHLGSKRLGELSALDVKRWHAVLLTSGRQDGRPLATNSVKLVHRVLHRALADAVRWNVIFVNPVSSVRVPQAVRRDSADKIAGFSHREASRRDHRTRAPASGALHCRVRLSRTRRGHQQQ